ncbi:unnamed protein product, partial [Symbiodinium microadriaticum]
MIFRKFVPVAHQGVEDEAHLVRHEGHVSRICPAAEAFPVAAEAGALVRRCLAGHHSGPAPGSSTRLGRQGPSTRECRAARSKAPPEEEANASFVGGLAACSDDCPACLPEACGHNASFSPSGRPHVTADTCKARRALGPTTATHGGPKHEAPPDLIEHVAQSLSTTTSFDDFAAALPRWLVKSRTNFGAFVASTFQSPSGRLGASPASAVLPLPLPYLGLFASSGPKLPLARWRRLRRRRLLHVVVCALNFVYCLGSWPSRALLWRAPNPHQRACYSRICAFLTACESREDRYPLPPGRSGPDLLARLVELESFASLLEGPGSSYGAPSSFEAYVGEDSPAMQPATFEHDAGPSPQASGSRLVPSVPSSDLLPQLQPYRSLDVSRLRLHGTGSWQLESFLDGPLWLPFLDPCVLRHGCTLAELDLPDLQAESRATLHSFGMSMAFWICGPLCLRRRLFRDRAASSTATSRPVDRQIGDRRPANRSEYHLGGPSAFLPQGHLLTAFPLQRYREKLCGFASDRKDFYHQVRASAERSDANRLPFAYPASCFVGTAALEHLLASCGARGKASHRASVMHSTFVPSFKSLLQGDHHGVEFALEGHQQLLYSHKPLALQFQLFGNRTPPLGNCWQAVVIDDLVNICAVPADLGSLSASPAGIMHYKAGAACPAEPACCPAPLDYPLPPYSPQRRLGVGVPDHPFYFCKPTLWLNGDRRGGYSRLEVGATALLSAVGEVGLETAPVSDEARHFDLGSPGLLVWFYSMLKAGYIRALVLRSPVLPVCGPSLGSTRGLRRATRLACRCRVLFSFAVRFARPVLLLSEKSHGPERCRALGRSLFRGANQFQTAGCAYGASCCSRLPVFSSGLLPRRLLRSCPCNRGQEEGPAVNPGFVPGLAWPVAKTFAAALEDAEPPQKAPGLESIVCNDLLYAATWSVETVLRWKGHHHINVLELSAFGALLRRVAREAPDSRVTTLLDSVVAKAAAAKGRSTSFALSPALAKACAVQLAFGIYTAFGFAPTRLNTADPPSRSRPLETRGGLLLSSCLPPEALHGLGEHRFRRALASWARLALVVLLSRGPPSHLLCDALAGRHAALPEPYVPDCHRDFDASLRFPGEGPCPALGPFGASPLLFSQSQLAYFGARAPTCWPLPVGRLLPLLCHSILHHTCLWTWTFVAMLPADPLLRRAFDSSLGFPGDGWSLVWLFFWVCSGLEGARAMDLSAPRTPADARRAELRRPLQLIADCVIRPVTRANRAKLLEDFDKWLRSTQDTTLARLLETPWEHAERISAALVLFGQQLFRIGAPYYRYSETINGVAAARPGVRRSLSAAWDLAFAWLSEEPHAHHRALPKGVLLAILSAALTWGWLLEAGLFALAWAGLLRIGEVLAATRRDLVLPRDAAPNTAFALLQIKAPKTRGRAAKHQASHVDPPDIIELLDLAFGSIPPGSPLWPMSAGTLRRRFKLLQARFGLTSSDGSAHFDLSSFRPGGATWMLHCTENPDLVRRRGRWMSMRVMEIYLQEVEAITYMPSLTDNQRDFLQNMAASFPALLKQAAAFTKA